jgi:hypothetical protein
VHQWLLDERRDKWVLILDNLDDASFLVEAQTTSQDGRTNGTGGGSLRPLVEYLPQCQNGTIIITTRSKAAALQLVEENNLIAVEPMEKLHAIALLEKCWNHRVGAPKR